MEIALPEGVMNFFLLFCNYFLVSLLNNELILQNYLRTLIWYYYVSDLKNCISEGNFLMLTHYKNNYKGYLIFSE